LPVSMVQALFPVSICLAPGVNQRRKYSEKVTNDSAVILLKKRVES